MAIRPIGPAPETSTSSPRTGNASAVWTALPNGSKIAAISSSTPGQWCQMLVIGQGHVLREGPGAAHAQPDGVRAQVAPAGQAVPAAAAHDVALARDEVARAEVDDVAADLDDLADELMPDDERRRDGLRGPGVPRLDMEVRAADPGLVDPDQDVVDADRGRRARPEGRGRVPVRV